MTPDRWKRSQEIFAAALEHGPEAREAFLEKACGGDAEIRSEAESLLVSHDAAPSRFMETPAIEVMASLGIPATSTRRLLERGARLGTFEILGPLGAGGMGEVYRAKDTRLGREVAIKVLPMEMASHGDRLKRFDNEARSASALNHPNIVTIYESGQSDGTPWIAMELVEGDTLRKLVGSLSTRKLLHIATQVAQGLARAHEAGIVHRDLKPENVMVTRDGVAKILDFGLAKLTAAGGSSDEGSEMPTMTGTQPGVVLGTVGYMSPEQVGGGRLDFRSDQFSFGSILYELASGKRAFQKKTAVDTLAAILNEDPSPLAGTAAAAPAPLRWLIERCLSKSPSDRYACTADLAQELRLLQERSTELGIESAESSSRFRRKASMFALAGLILGAIAIVASWWAFRAPSPDPPAIRRLTLSGRDSQPAVSPDGRFVAFSSTRDGSSRIWMKELAKSSESPITTGQDDSPRFSPDGRWVLFARREARGKAIFRISPQGGEPQRLIEDAFEADWSPDGHTIAFVRNWSGHGSLATVIGLAPSDGGKTEEIATLSNQFVWHPRFSADGGLIALVGAEFGGNLAEGRFVLLLRPDGKEHARLHPPRSGGHLSNVVWLGSRRDVIYSQAETVAAAGGALNAAGSVSTRFWQQSVATGRTRMLFTVPAPVEIVETLGPGRLVFDASDLKQNLKEIPIGASAFGRSERWLTHGDAIFRQPRFWPGRNELLLTCTLNGDLDLCAASLETGEIRQVINSGADDWDPALSADGKRIVWSSRRNGHFEVWIADSDARNPRRVTDDGRDAENPTMTPDGEWVVYTSGNPEKRGIWRIRADGTRAEPLVSGNLAWPEVSPDGRHVLYVRPITTESNAIEVVSIEGGKPEPFAVLQGSNAVGRARWMPDGRSIAFLGTDGRGTLGVYSQDFESGRDTVRMRRVFGGFDPEYLTETFAVSPDGRWLVVSYADLSRRLMTADGIPGVTLRGTK